MSGTFMGTSRSQWIWIATIWFGLGCFNATQTVFSMYAEGMHHAWVKLFITLLFAWVPMIPLTSVVLHLTRRYPPIRLRTPLTWAVHLGAYFLIGLISNAWLATFEHFLNPWADPSGPGPFWHRVLLLFASSLVGFFVAYVAIVGISYALDSKERLAQEQMRTAHLNEALSKTQLGALRRQIEPHFLFNSLNAIAGLVREDKSDAAVSMIAGLSDFLRHLVDNSNRQEVPLAEEIEYLAKYLDIQKIRFADRLAVQLQIPDDVLKSQVPSLILQPMVENAIKHGIAKRAQGGEIRVSAFRTNGTLTLRVYNDGPSLDPNGNARSGIGISNVRTRLQHLYGNEFELRLRNSGAHGVEASLSLPFTEK
jgi:two-component sensor histidine kinase